MARSIPFTAGLEGFWLAPDECSVAWATPGCGLIPAQSENRDGRFLRLINRGRSTCQNMIQQINHHTLLTHKNLLCNRHANRNSQNIYRCRITSDIISGLLNTGQLQLWGLVSGAFIYFYAENTVCSNSKCHWGGRWNVLLILYYVTNNLSSKYKQTSPTGSSEQTASWILWIFLERSGVPALASSTCVTSARSPEKCSMN